MYASVLHRTRLFLINRYLAVSVLACALLLSQGVGLLHRVEHSHGITQPQLEPHTTQSACDKYGKQSTHSCAAWDALTGIAATPPLHSLPLWRDFLPTLIHYRFGIYLPQPQPSPRWPRAPPTSK